ncbi:MAG: xylulose kinase [FCB group bacterium]|nr:xylulose kinase [FCB group bacterium]
MIADKPVKYIISHDMGTSSDKAILVTTRGEIINIASVTYPLLHPRPAWAEQDPEDWWKAIQKTTKSVLMKSEIDPEDVVGVTFSAQNQCLVSVDSSGIPLRPAISWMDSRAADIIRETIWKPPRIMGYNIFNVLKFLRITGGSPGQSGKDQIGRMLWLKKNEPEIFQRTAKFVDAKDYLIFKLTGEMVTSVDVAVIWWLLDTRRNRNTWHPDLCALAGITPEVLPAVKPSAEIVGRLTVKAAEKTGLVPGTPVINGAGDLAAAALGSGAIDEGELHISLGTSGWVAGHYRKRKIDIAHYTGCIGSTNPDKYYLAMAHQETAGACLEWLKHTIITSGPHEAEQDHASGIFEKFDELAATVEPGAAGLMFTPWMFGERCPLDDEFVRAGLFNLRLNHSIAHIVRAVFEGVALNTRWALETLENLYNPVEEINIIGGGGKSNIWCQIFADILNRKINRVAHPQQAGARGMALLASKSLGYLTSFKEIKELIGIDKTFLPARENRTLYDNLFREFKNIYKQNKKWYHRMNRIKGVPS